MEKAFYILDYRLSREQRAYFEENGFYCYDLRESCLYGDGATIEKNVLINNCGSIITTFDLGLNDKKQYVLLDEVMDKCKCLEYGEVEKYYKESLDLNNKISI